MAWCPMESVCPRNKTMRSARMRLSLLPASLSFLLFLCCMLSKAVSILGPTKNRFGFVVPTRFFTHGNRVAGAPARPFSQSFSVAPFVNSPFHEHRIHSTTATRLMSESNKKSPKNAACAPCSGLDESAILPLDEVQSMLADMPFWKLRKISSENESKPAQNPSDTSTVSLKGYCLSRAYVAKNFQAALDSINQIGLIAEREGHHPDIHLTNYRQVELEIYTHKLGGITENDITWANFVDDEVKITYSPKWLREHSAAQK